MDQEKVCARKLEGKAAIVTGAAMGLGEGIATVYAKYGADLLLIDMSEKVEETAEKLRKEYGANIATFIGNVTDPESLKAAAAKAKEIYGKIDILCCNAGVCKLAPFLESSDELRDFHIDVNIKGVWNTCKAVIPYMLEAGKGSVVIASSVTGDLVADPGEAAYALSKAALVGLTKALAIEYAGEGIRVNCSQLGYARTPMAEAIAKQSAPDDVEGALAEMAKGIPVKRLARPVEVGELFAFLGSDESSYITGSQFVIDGAATIRESNMGV